MGLTAQVALLSVPAFACAQELDVPYVETPDEVVDIMMELADVGRDDYVVDLGTGDGRLVIAAVKRGATGLGVDLDPRRVEEARENASNAGVSGRVMFLEQDLFDTDLRNASVVLLFLNSEVNLRLRPTLLEKLEPGTRVVSHNFDMREWQPDAHRQHLRNSDGSFYMHDVYYWIVPAEAAGNWSGRAGADSFEMRLEQDFQRVRATASLGQRQLSVRGAALNGRRLSVAAQDTARGAEYFFNGRIEGDLLSGVVQVRDDSNRAVTEWSASRKR